MTTTPSPEAVALAVEVFTAMSKTLSETGDDRQTDHAGGVLIDAALTAAKNKALTDLAEVCENAMALANKAGG